MPRKQKVPQIPPVTESARETEITATFLLKNLKLVPRYMREKRFEELACFADYLRGDVPRAIAQTDPALFRVLRRAVTDALVAGYGNMDGNHLRSLAAKQPKRKR